MYHYHSKLMMKEARTGGQHVWHQDYGYWYENGCLYSDMGSMFLALDVELQPGDGIFFHCNLLHTSAQNLSDKRRWSMICAYNARSHSLTIQSQ